MAIYMCPECGDIGCGVYCCEIEKINEMYIWKNFVYENNYEDAREINNIGAFSFEKDIYEKIVLELSLI